ncbi:MAG: zinc ribbon domain-containing protein [Ignavibacteriaceae bacterium]|nr:zinc ribbon domain-containing protein [Ignavibacteriaceae bacterium]
MALIQCPECGRENVSDTAETCPECGYGIKKHFNNIKYEQFKQRKEEDDEIKRQEEYQAKLDKIEMPIKPHLGGEFYFSLIWIGLCVFWILAEQTSIHIKTIMFFSFIFICIGFLFFSESIKLFEKDNDGYSLAQKDFEKYKETCVTDKEKRVAAIQSQIHSNVINKTSLTCPMCGSTNIVPISGMKKGTSALAFGAFAANTVLSRYQCKKCGHKF